MFRNIARFNINVKNAAQLNSLIMVVLCGILLEKSMAQPYDFITVTVHGWVYNQEGISDNNRYSSPHQSGVTVIPYVRYIYYSMEQNDYIEGFQSQEVISGYTSWAAGQFIASFDLNEEQITSIYFGVHLPNQPGWLLKDKAEMYLTETDYMAWLFVAPMNDADGNGIRDDFEWELVKKFCPSLVPNESTTKLCSEPIQIMGGDNNTQIYVTIVGGSENKLEIAHPIHLVRYKRQYESNWRTIIDDNKYGPDIKFTFGKSFNYSEEFRENPIKLNPNDSLRIYSKINTSYPYSIRKTGETQLIYIHFDWPRSTTREWWQEYYQERWVNNFPHTVYCTLWNDQTYSAS